MFVFCHTSSFEVMFLFALRHSEVKKDSERVLNRFFVNT